MSRKKSSGKKLPDSKRTPAIAGYKVEARGTVPADLAETISQAHARALLHALDKLRSTDEAAK